MEDTKRKNRNRNKAIGLLMVFVLFPEPIVTKICAIVLLIYIIQSHNPPWKCAECKAVNDHKLTQCSICESPRY